MADWLLLARAVALLSLPCLLLIYTLLLGTAPPPRGETAKISCYLIIVYGQH